MYVAPGGGRRAPGVNFCSESLIFSPTVHFLHNFPFVLHFNSFPHSNTKANYVDLAEK